MAMKILTVTTSTDLRSFEVTVIYVGDYIRYAELHRIKEELDEVQMADFVILSGKMPSWYALAITAEVVKRDARIVGIFRPPAKKVLVVWSQDETLPVGTWLKFSARLTEFCLSGRYPE